MYIETTKKDLKDVIKKLNTFKYSKVNTVKVTIQPRVVMFTIATEQSKAPVTKVTANVELNCSKISCSKFADENYLDFNQFKKIVNATLASSEVTLEFNKDTVEYTTNQDQQFTLENIPAYKAKYADYLYNISSTSKSDNIIYLGAKGINFKDVVDKVAYVADKVDNVYMDLASDRVAFTTKSQGVLAQKEYNIKLHIDKPVQLAISADTVRKIGKLKEDVVSINYYVKEDKINRTVDTYVKFNLDNFRRNFVQIKVANSKEDYLNVTYDFSKLAKKVETNVGATIELGNAGLDNIISSIEEVSNDGVFDELVSLKLDKKKNSITVYKNSPKDQIDTNITVSNDFAISFKPKDMITALQNMRQKDGDYIIKFENGTASKALVKCKQDKEFISTIETVVTE